MRMWGCGVWIWEMSGHAILRVEGPEALTIRLIISFAVFEALSSLGKVYLQSTIAWCVCRFDSRRKGLYPKSMMNMINPTPHTSIDWSYVSWSPRSQRTSSGAR